MAHLYELTNLFENQAKQDIGMYRGIVLEGAESKPEPSVHAITEQAAANHSQNDPIEILEGLLDEMEEALIEIPAQTPAFRHGECQTSARGIEHSLFVAKTTCWFCSRPLQRMEREAMIAASEEKK